MLNKKPFLMKKQVKTPNKLETTKETPSSILKFGEVCHRPDIFLGNDRSCISIKNVKCKYYERCNCEHLKNKKPKR